MRFEPRDRMDTKTVLNVDAHAPERLVRTRILQRARFGVDEVDNAASAIERAPASSLLLLDVKFPDADGFTVCEQVKKTALALPVVMITSVYRTSQAPRCVCRRRGRIPARADYAGAARAHRRDTPQPERRAA
jgi:CheY-like chemotaxis protein